MDTLLSDIEAFLIDHEMSARRFGELAMNDTRLVSNLRGDRSPSLKTVARLRRFMTAYPNHEKAAA